MTFVDGGLPMFGYDDESSVERGCSCEENLNQNMGCKMDIE